MNDGVSDVESQQEQPAWSEDSPQLPKRSNHVASRNVNDGVERDDARPRSVCGVQCQHVTLPERNPWIQAASTLDHIRRQVNAANLCSMLVQVASDVPRSAAHVARETESPHARGKAVQQLAVEGLVL